MKSATTSCATACSFALSLLSTIASALPPSAPGSVDPTYGDNGVLALGIRSGYEWPRLIVPTPAGQWLITGQAENSDRSGYVRYLLRLQGDGRIDTTFGAQGLAYPAGDPQTALVQASGGIVISNSVGSGGPIYHAELSRLTASGASDTSFGTASGVTVLGSSTAALSYERINHMDQDAQGRIIAGTSLLSADLKAQHGEVWRFSADGIPDASFGAQGKANLDAVAPYVQVMRVRAQADGKVVVAMWCRASDTSRTDACVVRLNADGSRDATFGVNGARELVPPPGTDYPIYDLRIPADGKIYVAGSNYTTYPPKAVVFRLNADGSPDATYGTGGAVLLQFAGQAAYANAIHPLADGRQIVVGAVVGSSSPSFGYVARLAANGQLDPTFGNGGIAPPATAADHSFGDGVVLADGRILGVGTRDNVPGTSTDVDTLLVRYVGVETTTAVVEFYNSVLKHYFITADPVEAAAIDGGSAGPGWSRTGQTFKSGGPARVCRFYGSLEINPATGLRRGPNSHFYTISSEECALVKTDPGWHFESYDFNGWPLTGQTCPAGTVAVKRLYNNRFAQNDSNHRYTVSDAIFADMTAQGWYPEGPVFCAVQ